MQLRHNALIHVSAALATCIEQCLGSGQLHLCFAGSPRSATRQLQTGNHDRENKVSLLVWVQCLLFAQALHQQTSCNRNCVQGVGVNRCCTKRVTWPPCCRKRTSESWWTRAELNLKIRNLSDNNPRKNKSKRRRKRGSGRTKTTLLERRNGKRKKDQSTETGQRKGEKESYLITKMWKRA